VRRDLAAMGLVVFNQARNELVTTLASDQVPRNLMALRAVLNLTPAAATKLGRELLEVLRSAKAGKKPARGKTRTYAVTIALVPTEESA